MLKYVDKYRKGVCFMVLITLCLLNLFGSGKKDESDDFKKSEYSPSGKYMYSVEEKDKNYFIDIYENNKLVFSDNQSYRMQDRFYITWHEVNDILWLYSGDIGTFYFCIENGQWKRKTFIYGEMNGDLIPLKLKESVPIIKKLLYKD